MRGKADEVRRAGGELVFVGNGSAMFAAGFAEDLKIDSPILLDPELEAYRAAGLRRGYTELLSPRMPLHAIRAWRSGFRQTGVEGDAFQLGGVLVVRAGGELVYRYASREAGDHAPIDDVLGALRGEGSGRMPDDAPGAITRVAGEVLSRVVDPTIALSFDRTGYAIHSLTFDPADMDVDLRDRRCLVTGANSGIGFETALELADLGAEVVLVCRDEGRGAAAAEKIREATGNRSVSASVLDVAELGMIREVAPRLAEGPVDVLIHNAGVLPDRRVETRDGLELTFATHVAGPFLLTELLRGAMGQGSRSRVVWVSSGGMYTRALQIDDPQWRARAYDGVRAYAETKRAQVVLAELWAEELESVAAVSSMHPGWADTPAVRASLPMFHKVTEPFLRTPSEGADTVVWLAAAAAAEGASGEFFFDRRPRWKHLLPGTVEIERDRQRLWKLCRRVTLPSVEGGGRSLGNV